MKNNLKLFVNATLMFAAIGFVSYLLILVAGFLGCCTGITTTSFYQIIFAIGAAALITFGYCIYNNCYKTRKNKM